MVSMATDDAVSPVIGTILMVAVTVIVAAIIKIRIQLCREVPDHPSQGKLRQYFKNNQNQKNIHQ